MKNVIISALALGVLGAAASAQDQAQDQPLTIAVFTKNNTNPAYEAARLAADQVAQEAGATTVHYVPEKPDDIDQQRALIDKMLAGDHPDLVLFVPVHDTKMEPDLHRITSAGLPVVTFVNRIKGDVIAHVGSDDVAVGKAAADRLFAEIGDKGKILAVAGTPAAVTSRQRVEGLEAALAEHPEIELLETLAGMYQREPAHDETLAALARHPEVDAIWTANDVMAYGVIQALKESGRSAEVSGTNGLDEAIAMIKAGEMVASVDFSSFKMACIAARAGLLALDEKPVPADIKIPVSVITAENAAEFDIPLAQRKCPSWQEIVGD
ncbi:sugar ABC transporter substrate-binding protein [Paracoccus sp. MBLB3053]|uniref:Sugar ABC transporter substrate-binding protein n=1 Tax=Paracoccus aurantius TaxID=3073814 RepID=A0ABU2HZW3_9RHOB|nr:sugar ABC transporter substrate-binding protein [Paracoccus sp. MBLB3053]MDS9469834.1 sugar ABC transporter substrate-binding protein [Paracoccus sp. MBLB3053]